MSAPILFVALDVSLEKTSLCLVTSDGIIAREVVVATEPEAIAAELMPDLARIARVGLEAGPLSEWLVRGLATLGIEVVLMETRQVRAALSAMIVKTDRKDARGMAQLLRAGWFRPVHVKTTDARELRTMLAVRATLVARLRDIENSVRGLLRGYGLRLPKALRGRWEPAVRDLLDGNPGLLQILEPLLGAREALRDQLDRIDRRVRETAKADTVCRRLMSASGVGVIVALTFRAAVDQPERFRSSKQVGADFGLTPRKYQSGETDRNGAISRAGDVSVRVALFEAAHVILTRVSSWSSLKAWAMSVAKRRGAKRAKVALARKLGVVLHRMWVDGTNFRFGRPEPASA
ncbi:IS110 family transposase [Methylobacterium sp. DCY52]|uniref:IS110 family transposase n=1 Tax=Methylobacterium sp. DCY52 TaxID=739139 RepID=UPI0031456BD0